jgi:hypothetical protein
MERSAHTPWPLTHKRPLHTRLSGRGAGCRHRSHAASYERGAEQHLYDTTHHAARVGVRPLPRKRGVCMRLTMCVCVCVTNTQDRKRANEAAAAMRSGSQLGSRPGSAAPAIKLSISLTAGTKDEQLKVKKGSLNARGLIAVVGC